MKKIEPNTKIIHNYNEWIIESLLQIIYIFLLIITLMLFKNTPLKQSRFIRFQYEKNWVNGYIVELIPTNNGSCGTGYNLTTFGYWSGIDNEKSCICSFNSNFLSSDSKSICNHDSDDNLYKKIFKCQKIRKIDSVPLKNFKYWTFCVKRNYENIFNLHENIKTSINEDDYKNYYESLLNHSIKINLNQTPITEILISSKNLTDDNYNVKSLDNETNIYLNIKYLSNKENVNIFEFNDFITSIHFNNELICAYNDMNNIEFIDDNEYLNSLGFNYNGFKSCKNFKINDLNYKNFSIQDNYIRTKKIMDDDLLPNFYEYFYSNISTINNYYNQMNINDYIYKNIKNVPQLVSQQYFYGIGCPFMSSVEKHFKKFGKIRILKNLIISITVFILLSYVSGVFFLIFRIFNNCYEYSCCFWINAILMFLNLGIAIILTSVYLGIGMNTYKYFVNFQKYCTIDLRGINNNNENYNNYLNKITPIEKNFVNNISMLMMYSLSLLMMEIIIVILKIVYLVLNYDEHKFTFFDYGYNYYKSYFRNSYPYLKQYKNNINSSKNNFNAESSKINQ